MGGIPGCGCNPEQPLVYAECVGGEWFSVCDSDDCTGRCAPHGPCACPCHREAS